MNDYNKYIGLNYHKYKFNCWHLTKKILHEVFNISLPDYPNTNDLPLCDKLDKPVEGCLALMYSYGTHSPDHVGVCINKNQILHCHGSKPQSGLSEIRACEQMFWKVEFYGLNNCTL